MRQAAVQNDEKRQQPTAPKRNESRLATVVSQAVHARRMLSWAGRAHTNYGELMQTSNVCRLVHRPLESFFHSVPSSSCFHDNQ